MGVEKGRGCNRGGPQCLCQLIFGTLASSSAPLPWLYKQTTAWSSLTIKHRLIKPSPLDKPGLSSYMCLKPIELLKIYLLPSCRFIFSSRICLNLTELLSFRVLNSRYSSRTRMNLLSASIFFCLDLCRHHQILKRKLPICLCEVCTTVYLPPCNTVKQHNDPVTPWAVTWRHKLHVNQSRVCPEVVSCTISKMALQPFC